MGIAHPTEAIFLERNKMAEARIIIVKKCKNCPYIVLPQARYIDEYCRLDPSKTLGDINIVQDWCVLERVDDENRMS